MTPDTPNIIPFGQPIKDRTPIKECPECGGKLVVRTNRANGSQFLGCENYPECDHKEPIRTETRMRLAGQPELPLEDN